MLIKNKFYKDEQGGKHTGDIFYDSMAAGGVWHYLHGVLQGVVNSFICIYRARGKCVIFK